MTKKQSIEPIYLPKCRLMFVDLQSTAKFKDKQTGENRDSGWYMVNAFFDKSRKAEFRILKDVIDQATSAITKGNQEVTIKRLFKQIDETNEIRPNTIAFTAKTKYIDNLVTIDEHTKEEVPINKFYPGCWVRLLVVPNVYRDEYGTIFQQCYLNGISFVENDEPLGISYSYDEMLARMGGQTKVLKTESNDEW